MEFVKNLRAHTPLPWEFCNVIEATMMESKSPMPTTHSAAGLPKDQIRANFKLTTYIVHL